MPDAAVLDGRRQRGDASLPLLSVLERPVCRAQSARRVAGGGRARQPLAALLFRVGQLGDGLCPVHELQIGQIPDGLHVEGRLEVFRVAFGYAFHLTPIEWRENAGRAFRDLAWPLQSLIGAAVTVVAFQLALPDVQPFIYFQF